VVSFLQLFLPTHAPLQCVLNAYLNLLDLILLIVFCDHVAPAIRKSGGHSVSIVRSQTQAMEFRLFVFFRGTNYDTPSSLILFHPPSVQMPSPVPCFRAPTVCVLPLVSPSFTPTENYRKMYILIFVFVDNRWGNKKVLN
jgi:hypothetical protein